MRMIGAVEMLVEEHRLIEQVLESLEAFVDAPGDENPGRADIRDYVTFFREYVDKCHHGKEEDYLFVRMSSYGFSQDHGPISAMLSEQDEGRDHLNAMAAVGERSGEISAHERELVKGHALAYVMRLRAHLQREDDILFPMVSHALPQFELDELAASFEKFDREVLPTGFHDRLNLLARRLIDLHPPREAGDNRVFP